MCLRSVHGPITVIRPHNSYPQNQPFSVTNSFLLTHMQNILSLTPFQLWLTCTYLKVNMPFSYVYLIFTLCFTCVCLKANTLLYLFKPVVKHLCSLAFHWEFYHSYSELLDLRQYLVIGNLSIFEQNISLKLDLWTTWLLNFNRQTCSVLNVSTGSLSSLLFISHNIFHPVWHHKWYSVFLGHEEHIGNSHCKW